MDFADASLYWLVIETAVTDIMTISAAAPDQPGPQTTSGFQPWLCNSVS
jgi:hypothetical protein